MNIILSEQLKRLRQDRGNTQQELAEYLCVSKQAVSKWECGRGYPDITLLPGIADYYNVSIVTLLGIEKADMKGGSMGRTLL